MERTSFSHRRLIAASVLLGALAVGSLASRATNVSVEMRDNYFEPATVTISVGDTVTWVHKGGRPHDTVSYDQPGWFSDLLTFGETYSFTFENQGTFEYYCTVHEIDGMKGTVIVQPANQPPQVELLSPAANAIFSTNSAIPLLASATDPDPGDVVTNVTFFDGVSAVGAKTAAPYSVTLSNLAAGVHVLTARAADSRGTLATSAPVSISVVVPAELRIASVSRSNTVTSLSYTATPGLTYVVETSGTVTNAWNTLLTNVSSSSIETVAHTNGSSQFFYRVALWP